ncbi:MAG: TonB-dependent receptor, partial [Flavobacteriales bacterium]|nr:TonB-dependent receptor [Flavobacteriales bacterium]
LEDYFNEVDESGFRTYAVDAFRPVYIAGYIMDKFAFDDIIFNVGVRVDRFDANQKVLKDEYIVRDFYTVGNNPDFDEHPSNIGDDYVVYVDDPLSPTQVRGYRTGDDWFTADGTPVVDPEQLQIGVSSYPYLTTPENELSAAAFEDYEPQVNVMPRVAFSFPISDEAVFFAHYDILTQRPERGIRLQLQNYEFIQTQANVINNPALRPTKTIDYELGFQQVLSRSSSLKISAFYRDMRDMIQVRQLPGAFPEDYVTYRNIDFGTVKGLTLIYDLRRTGNTRINANYTLQFASGTGSNSTSGLNLASSGQPNLQNITPLAFDQRHAINVTLDYRYGEGKDYNGPVWFGKQFFANTGLNLIGNLGSGTPYSNTKRATNVLDGRTSGGLAGTLNGARLPSLFTLNAQLDKNITLKFGKNDEGEKAKTANLNIYLLVNNVLNTENVVRVYPFTGSAEDDGFLVTPEGQQSIAQAPSPQAFQDLYFLRLIDPYNYGRGRTIQLGVKLDF